MTRSIFQVGDDLCVVKFRSLSALRWNKCIWTRDVSRDLVVPVPVRPIHRYYMLLLLTIICDTPTLDVLISPPSSCLDPSCPDLEPPHQHPFSCRLAPSNPRLLPADAPSVRHLEKPLSVPVPVVLDTASVGKLV